jgi:hypothetical protein
MRQLQRTSNVDGLSIRQRLARMEQRQHELMRLLEERLPPGSDRSKPG